MRRAPITILYAEDDPDDRMLTADALRESQLVNDLVMVEDGTEVLSYLRREGRWSDPSSSPRPGIILMDLNMPKMDGGEALAAIKSDRRFASIPVVIMTTSRADADIVRSYEIGANSYIAKPATFDGLVQVMADLGRYWFEIVRLPGPER
jgi:two-component system response regulator